MGNPTTTTTTDSPAYLSVADVGATFGISKSSINRLLAAGHLTAIKAGARTLIDATSVRGYFAALPAAIYNQNRAA